MKTREEWRAEYIQKLRDPRWQRLRLEVFERDEWRCQHCFDGESMLAVHHRFYENGKEPWEYPLGSLVTLCEPCHERETAERPKHEQALVDALRRTPATAVDIAILAEAFDLLVLTHEIGVVIGGVYLAMRCEGVQKDLLKHYFDSLKAVQDAAKNRIADKP